MFTGLPRACLRPEAPRWKTVVEVEAEAKQGSEPGGGAVTEKCREARAQGPLREKLRLRNRRGQVKATQL